MTEETEAEYQYSYPIASFFIQFPRGEAAQVIPGNYPGYDWHNYSELVGKVEGLIGSLRKQTPNLMGMELFYELKKIAESNPSFIGRTSHVLLSLFNRGYFGDSDDVTHTGLDKYVWDANTGQPINPTFKKSQVDLPVNLQIRQAISDAADSDMRYHQSISKGDDLAGQQAQWDKSLHESLLTNVQIKPAGQLLI